MRSSLLIPALPLLFSIACSAAPGDDVADDSLAASENGICAPLDYGHTTTPADYYRFFPDDAATGAFIEAVMPRLAEMTGPEAVFREVARDGRLDTMVAELFEGFRRAFPNETRGLTTPPPVVVIESEVVNAYALGAGITESADAPQDRAPWLFVVHTGILTTANDDELRGVFAHELGHLILRTFTPEVQRRVRAIYEVPESGDRGVFGAAQDDDPRIAAHVEKIIGRQSRVGAHPGLGMSVVKPGEYVRTLRAMVDAAPASEACTAAKTHRDELWDAQVALLPHHTEGNLVPREPTAAERAELDRLSTLLASDFAACVAPLKAEGSLAQLVATLKKLPLEAAQPDHPQHAALLAQMLPAEIQVDAEMPTATLPERILRAEAILREELVALRADPAFPIDRIRVFDYEEDADDAAVRVLAAIGRKPTSVGDFFLTAQLTPETRAQCIADVAAGKPIPYGQLLDPHQPACWRYAHVAEYARALAGCGAETSRVAKAHRPDAPASALDRDPLDIAKDEATRRLRP